MATTTDIMRRLQWAQFMNLPVSLTHDELRALLYRVASNEYVTVRSDAAFWTHINPEPYLSETFMIEHTWWDTDIYDADKREWVVRK